MADNKEKKMSKEVKDALKLKFWKQVRGAHKPKNRSSKHLRFFHVKDIYRCVSNAQLKSWANNGDFNASQEQIRRDKKRDNREAKMA